MIERDDKGWALTPKSASCLLRGKYVELELDGAALDVRAEHLHGYARHAVSFSVPLRILRALLSPP